MGFFLGGGLDRKYNFVLKYTREIQKIFQFHVCVCGEINLYVRCFGIMVSGFNPSTSQYIRRNISGSRTRGERQI